MTNATKEVEHIQLVQEWFQLSECECENESLHVAISMDVNVLLDGKSLHTQDYHRVAHTAWRRNYKGPLITFIIRIRRSHSDYTQVES